MNKEDKEIKSSKKKKINFFLRESKCKRCGNDYPPYEVIKKGKVVNQGYYPNYDCVIEIKFKKWQIPLLLGAAILAINAENWCAKLSEASEEGMDRDDDDFDPNFYLFGGNASVRWQRHLDLMMDQVREKSGLKLEYVESADRVEILKTIEKLVEGEKIRRLKNYNGVHIDRVNREWIYRQLPIDQCASWQNE